MNLYFDTSALIKKYIFEAGSEQVDELMNKADRVFVSEITEIESYSTFKRLSVEKAINENEYDILKNEFEFDNQYFDHVGFDENIINTAKSLIEKYQLKTLDSIQLGSALILKEEIDYFVACDEKLIASGKKEGLRIINPVA